MIVKNISLLFILLISSCASTSNIVPAGPDTYMISGYDRSIGASGGIVKAELFKQASDYCTKENKVFVPVNSSGVDYKVFRNLANAELTFRCFKKDDPELKKLSISPLQDNAIIK